MIKSRVENTRAWNEPQGVKNYCPGKARGAVNKPNQPGSNSGLKRTAEKREPSRFSFERRSWCLLYGKRR
jgi:hypothetical protein